MKLWKTAELLQEAINLVTGERARQHGDLLGNHQNIARLWSAYLKTEITAPQVAMMMALLKIARTGTGAYNADDFTDAAAYACISGELRDGK